MPHYARINDGEVREVKQLDSIEGRFHQSLTWIECPDSVEQGYKYDNSAEEFSPPQQSELTLSEAKRRQRKRIRSEANDILSKTDWYIIRNKETGESIPESILQHRATVRSQSDTYEDEIKNLSTVSEVLNYDYNLDAVPDI
jgi:hypothetical protein